MKKGWHTSPTIPTDLSPNTTEVQRLTIQSLQSIKQTKHKYAATIGVPTACINGNYHRALRGHGIHERLQLVGRKRLKAFQFQSAAHPVLLFSSHSRFKKATFGLSVFIILRSVPVTI